MRAFVRLCVSVVRVVDFFLFFSGVTDAGLEPLTVGEMVKKGEEVKEGNAKKKSWG